MTGVDISAAGPQKTPCDPWCECQATKLPSFGALLLVIELKTHFCQIAMPIHNVSFPSVYKM